MHQSSTYDGSTSQSQTDTSNDMDLSDLSSKISSVKTRDNDDQDSDDSLTTHTTDEIFHYMDKKYICPASIIVCCKYTKSRSIHYSKKTGKIIKTGCKEVFRWMRNNMTDEFGQMRKSLKIALILFVSIVLMIISMSMNMWVHCKGQV